jgi:hypothetical protein
MNEDENVTAPVEKKTSAKKSAGAQARYAAIKELIHNHQDEFNALYVVEAEKRGVRTRSSSKADKIAKLEAKLAELKEGN